MKKISVSIPDCEMGNRKIWKLRSRNRTATSVWQITISLLWIDSCSSSALRTCTEGQIADGLF